MATAKRKNPKRVAAAKKGAATRRKNLKSRTYAITKAPTRRKSAVRRRKKKGILSEFFSPAAATNAAKVIVNGGVGAIGIAYADKLIFSKVKNPMRYALLLGMSFVTGAVLKKPQIASGMAGVTIFKILTESGLAENFDLQQNWVNDVQNLPPMIDVNGNPILAENQVYDLQENTDYWDLQQNGMGEAYGSQYIPGY